MQGKEAADKRKICGKRKKKNGEMVGPEDTTAFMEGFFDVIERYYCLTKGHSIYIGTASTLLYCRRAKIIITPSRVMFLVRYRSPSYVRSSEKSWNLLVHP